MHRFRESGLGLVDVLCDKRRGQDDGPGHAFPHHEPTVVGVHAVVFGTENYSTLAYELGTGSDLNISPVVGWYPEKQFTR